MLTLNDHVQNKHKPRRDAKVTKVKTIVFVAGGGTLEKAEISV
jgi:hypothetical protein